MGQARDEAGNIWETDAAGNAVRLVTPAGAGPDPFKVRDQQMQEQAAARATAAEERKAAAQENTNERTGAATKVTADKLAMDLATSGLAIDAQGNVVPRPGGAIGSKEGVDPSRVAKLKSLVEQINRTQELYEAGPGSTSGATSILDYNPFSDINSRFDTAGAQIAEKGLAAFRVPGVGTQTDRDAIIFERANMPVAANRDAAIEEKLRGMRERVEAEYQTFGLPAPDWQMSAAPRGTGMGVVENETGIATGATAATAPPTALLAGLEGYLRARRGTQVDRQDFAAFYNDLAARNDFPGGDPESLDRYIEEFNKTGSIGGVAPATRATTQGERDQGAFLSSAPGAALATYLNAGGAGIPGLLAGDGAMDAIRDESPMASLAGDVAGSITGTGLAAKGLGMAGIAAPKALAAANLGYGTTFGATSNPDDPLTGAGVGLGASLVGAGAGKAIGAGISGVTNPVVNRLSAANIPMTLGQLTGRSGRIGAIAKGFEDRMAGIPILGDAINARRMEGVEAFNRNILNDAVAPVNGVVRDVRETGVEQAQQAISAGYTRALSGVNAAPDQRFISEMRAAAAKGSAADAARGKGDYGYILQNQLRPLAGNSPKLNGETLQDALRLLKGQERAYNKAANGLQPDPMASAVADALGDTSKAITGLVTRRSPGTMKELDAANSAYRRLGIVEDATLRASNSEGLFTPAQLGMSMKASAAKLGSKKSAAAGKGPFAEMQRDAQMVLPNKVPDSGTAGRLAIGAFLPAAVAGGAGAASATDYLDPKTAALIAALSMPATKTGSKVLQKALIGGPSRQAAGKMIRKYGSAGGAVASPLAQLLLNASAQ